jgi:hypothetical protein
MRSDGKQYEDTILHALLNNDELRREEKSLGRLADEAEILVGAGVRAPHELSFTQSSMFSMLQRFCRSYKRS